MDIDSSRYWDDNLPEDMDVDVDLEKLGFPRTGVRDIEVFAHLEKIASRIVNAGNTERQPEDAPFLGSLVPGADSGIIYASNPSTRRLKPIAVSNLSEDIVNAFSGEWVQSAADRPEPHSVISPSGNQNGGHGDDKIKTLWLVPWKDSNGNLWGAYLFASSQKLSPGRDAQLVITLLTALLKATILQLDHGSGECRVLEALDRLVKDLNVFPQAGNNGKGPRLFGQDGHSDVTLSMFTDNHGLPVIYDAETQEEEKADKPDDISMLWHELLSPLTVIKGYTSTILQFNDSITEQEKMQYIQGIDSASDRVIRLLENLRDVSRLEDNEATVKQAIDVLELLRIIVPEVQDRTNTHIIKLRPPAHLPRVKIDPEKIEQVLSNLLVNAIKYSPQGGDIDVEVQVARNEQELNRMYPGSPVLKLPCIVVSIADRGIGIPETELDQIFKRFYRVKNRFTHSVSGAGLGLYICRIIVESHGGNIWARNRLQGGSIFNFSLPMD